MMISGCSLHVFPIFTPLSSGSQFTWSYNGLTEYPTCTSLYNTDPVTLRRFCGREGIKDSLVINPTTYLCKINHGYSNMLHFVQWHVEGLTTLSIPLTKRHIYLLLLIFWVHAMLWHTYNSWIYKYGYR